MHAKPLAGPQAESFSAIKRRPSAPFPPERRAGLAHAHDRVADVAYAGLCTRLARQLAAAEQLVDELRSHNADLQRRLAAAARREVQVHDDACRDVLTGLPNRRRLKDRLDQESAHAARRKRQVALLFIDLDGFKSVNDRFGHAAGDQLLCTVATRLLACLRASDTACRYGGDEFVVLIPELDGAKALAIATDKIRRCIEAPYLIDGKAMAVGASIGCALSRPGAILGQSLIEEADAAMYRAKLWRKQCGERAGRAPDPGSVASVPSHVGRPV